MSYIDLFAFEMEIAHLQKEAEDLGVPHAIRAALSDVRSKVLPAISKARGRQS